MEYTSLVSTQTRVESPFIIAKIGDYTFGKCEKTSSAQSNIRSLKITYPNFITSLATIKVNGAVNMYTLTLSYSITETDDPNLIDRILSSVANSRQIKLSYGDWNMPGFIYKEEEAIITKVSQKVDFNASKIVYTIKCTSNALKMGSVKRNFPSCNAKPSDKIIALLKDESTGLMEIFPGMRNLTKSAFAGLIAQDDKSVQIEAKDNISVLDYITYLVKCMVNVNDSDTNRKHMYFWSVYDDINNTMGGQFFKVVKVTSGLNYKVSYSTYEVDVGYPSANYVTAFEVNNDDSWSILYNYSQKVEQPQYTYTIDNDGNVNTTFSPGVTTSTALKRATEENKNWWAKMTQFPVTSKLTIKGLLRPAMLMSYVKVNAYFYGHKHISSGLYIITKQEDMIDNNGYKTTLSLTRVSGDTEYEKS